MRVLKPIFYSAMAITTLVGCSSVSKIPVPQGSNTVVEMTSKKAPLTDYEKDK